MKKKIINGVLMFALLVSGMNAFVSCKDIDDENYITMQQKINENLTLTALLQQQYAKLQTTLDAMKSCDCADKGYLTQADLVGYVTQADLSGFLTQADLQGYVTQADIQNFVTQAQLAGYLTQEQAQEFLKQADLAGYVTAEQLTNALTGYLTKIEAQATYLTIANWNVAKTELDSLILIVQNRLDTTDSVLTNHKDSIHALIQQVSQNSLTIKTLNAKVDVLDSLAKDNKKRLDLLQPTVTKLDSLANLWIVDIQNLKDSVTNLNSLIVQMGNRLDAVSDKAIAAEAKANAVDEYAKACRKSIDSLCAIIANLPGVNLSNYVTKSDLEEALNAFNIPDTTNLATKQELQDLKTETQGLVQAVESIANSAATDAANALSEIATINTTVGELSQEVDKCIKQEEYEQKVQKIDNSLDEINEKLAKFSKDLRNMITNIIVQGTKNPIIGYANAPVDVRSLILAAYKGYSDTGFEFPSRQAADYLNETDYDRFWTPRRLHVLGVNSIRELEGWQKYEAGNFIDERDGNAGKVYLTINPTRQDFDGIKLKGLYTSQGRKSPITLSNVRHSEDELSFGYTRGGKEEGFYEADATLKKEDMGSAAGIDVEFRTLASEIKTALQKRDKSSLMVLANDILRNASNITPAYAVKVSWTDSINGDEHDIISQYGIAATAIKPLSYGFMKDYKRNSMPGFGRLQDFVGRIINTIDSHINLDLPDFSKYEGSITFKDIELPDIDDDMLRITYNKTYTSEDLAGSGKLYGDTENVDLFFLVTTVKDGKYALVGVDDNGNNILYIKDTVTDMWRPATADEIATWGAIEFGLTVDVDINKTDDFKETLQEIIDSLNDDFGEDSNLAKTMTDLLNDIASMGDLDEKIHSVIKDDLKSTINQYLTRINNKLTKWFNNAHKALYITMLGEQNNALGIISESRYRPTKAKAGSVTLRPTSFSFEYFAPAYKKFVGISNVYKASDKSELPETQAIEIASRAKGNNMGKVITPSLTHDDEVIIKGEAGYIYEILYTAVDYHGVSTIKKFYIQF